jgi:hypothetical protein
MIGILTFRVETVGECSVIAVTTTDTEIGMHKIMQGAITITEIISVTIDRRGITTPTVSQRSVITGTTARTATGAAGDLHRGTCTTVIEHGAILTEETSAILRIDTTLEMIGTILDMTIGPIIAMIDKTPDSIDMRLDLRVIATIHPWENMR